MSEILEVMRCRDGASLPKIMRPDDSCFDVAACLDKPHVVLSPFEQVSIPTGLKFNIPKGFELAVRPRSGLALKHGITIVNTPGTIDRGYKGEISILLIKLTQGKHTIANGERIAQIALQKVPSVALIEVQDVGTSERGEQGWGGTGV